MRRRDLLFPAVLATSVAAHGWFLVGYRGSPTLPLPEGETVATIILEAPPDPPQIQPEEILPPPPEPELPDEPPVPEEAEVMTAEVEEAPPAPPPTPAPTPKPTPQSLPKKKATNPVPRPPAAYPSAKKGAVVAARPDSPRNRPPSYPEHARRQGWEGNVMVRAQVGVDGKVQSVSIARSSGYGILDQAALRAVKGWKFRPQTVGGTPSTSTVEVPVNFSLRR